MFDRSSATVILFDTLTVLTELILWLKYCDIFSLSQVRILLMMDDEVSRQLEFLRSKEKRGYLYNLADSSGSSNQPSLPDFFRQLPNWADSIRS